MDTICADDIKTIMKEGGGAHVSIFMPSHHKGGLDQQDPIRLKNLLSLAKEKLVANGLRTAEAQTMIAPTESLLTDNLFWRQQSNGLALFIKQNQYFYYRVPVTMNEFVGVSNRFYVRPILSLLSDCGVFYVLAVSQDENRLLQCTANGSARIELKDAPKNLDEASRYEANDDRVQYHITSQKQGSNFGGSTAVQSGEGSRPNYTKRNIMQYLESLNKAVYGALKNDKIPMVLATIDYIHPMYKKANQYKNLLETGITGSPDGLSDESLRMKAMEVVKPYFEKEKMAAVDEYYKTVGTGLTTSDLKEAIVAAKNGRVRYLFINDSSNYWGTLDENDQVTVNKNPELKDDDLIDLAAYYTLNSSGTIYIVDGSEMPGNAVSAILRY